MIPETQTPAWVMFQNAGVIDAIAQTRSGSGRCDISHEKALAEMILECIEEGRQASPN